MLGLEKLCTCSLPTCTNMIVKHAHFPFIKNFFKFLCETSVDLAIYYYYVIPSRKQNIKRDRLNWKLDAPYPCCYTDNETTLDPPVLDLKLANAVPKGVDCFSLSQWL